MNDRNVVFQCPAPSFLSHDSINTLAEKISGRLGYFPGGDLFKIIDNLGGEIKYLDMERWFQTESGSIEVYGPNDFQIFLSQFTTSARDTFTLAHELGHYVLHSESGQKPIKVSRHGSSRLEWEANWFAAGFLMPTDAVTKAIRQGVTAQQLAEKFQTSVSAINIRAKSLGLEIKN